MQRDIVQGAEPGMAGEGATAAQLKHDIDSGRTGDKAPGFDPAAAPLGVDEEAGGAPTDPAMLQQARVAEHAGRPTSDKPNAVAPQLAPDGASRRRQPYLLAILIGVAAAIVLALVLTGAL